MKTFRYALVGLLSLACTPYAASPHVLSRRGSPSAGELHLIESWPSETRLNNSDIDDAAATWVRLIDGAQTSLDFLHFYGASTPEGRLVDVLQALRRASRRGVQIRFIFDRSFYENQPDVPDQLAQLAGVSVRILDLRPISGGVQHAKLFVIDERITYLGSQNFDWRSLEHIQELGVILDDARVTALFSQLFALDWELAGGATVEFARNAVVPLQGSMSFPMRFRGQPIRVTPVFSPQSLLLNTERWDLPHLLRMIREARSDVRIQLMSYHATFRDGRSFSALEDALRHAAERGVRVRLLLSNWNTRPSRLPALRALASQDGLDIRIVTIPPHSGGFIPFARVIHSKYVTVDGSWAWLGTSNFGGDYFHHSRNAGIVVEGNSLSVRLERLFDDLWSSTHSDPLRMEGEYPTLRIAQ